MKKTSKFLLILAVLVCCLALFSGCGDSSETNSYDDSDINSNVDLNAPALGLNVPDELVGRWEGVIQDNDGNDQTYGYVFNADGTGTFYQDSFEAPCMFECSAEKIYIDIKINDEVSSIDNYFRIEGDKLIVGPEDNEGVLIRVG